MYCECCSKGRVLTTVQLTLKEQSVTARLCTDCREAGHFLSRCNVCSNYTWFCARLDHAAQYHSELLPKLENVQREVDQIRESGRRKGARKIGTLRF